MLTKDFLELLQQHPEMELVFEYRPQQFVPASYHITEVKNVLIESVDCGGRPDNYAQTVVQLWVNKNEPIGRNMLTQKALKIFDIVNSKTPLRPATEIFFEWGDSTLPTSNYVVDQVSVQSNRLVLQLTVPPTACKPSLEIANLAGAACCN
ncbi:MAG: hypothetical protein HUU01_14335 [Saprospiraceae bacterium]|nr:hypothetical protein [Saprospiraceae bacterium]